MLKLVIGTDWVAIRNQILDMLAEDVHNKKENRILLVPELISHDMERRLCMTAGDTASRYAQVLSFTRLVRRVSEYIECAPRSCLDNGGRVIAMAAAAQQLHSRLKAYAAVETKPEFLVSLVDAVDEFKRCCIRSNDLADAASQLEGTLAQKLEELSLLYDAYDGLCENGRCDPRDQMDWLLEQLEDCDFAKEHIFYIDGFPDFTRQNLAILAHCIQNSQLVIVGMNCDKPGSKALAFEKAGETASALMQIANVAGVPVEIMHTADNPSGIGAACRSLFQGALPKNLTQVQAYHEDTPMDEVQLVAAKIMGLVKSGCRFRDIGVACADISGYSSYIRLLFRRFGIPNYLSGTQNVLESPVIAAVLSALEAALGGFEQRAVLRYLRSSFSGLSPDVCDEIENYAILWGIKGKRWLADWTKHPDGLSGIDNEESTKRLCALNLARNTQMQPLQRLCDAFRDSQNLGQQVLAVYSFIEDMGFAERLDSLAMQMESDGDYRSAQILNQLWEILLVALEQMYDILGQTYWNGENFTALLKLLLSQYDVGTIPPVLDSVTIGSISNMRCQQVKHLFVLGAEEGSLPGYAGSEGLLSDQERIALRNLGVPLTGGAMEGIQAEFAEIYGVFCGAEESVTISYSGAQPSYLFRRMTQMVGSVCQIDSALGSAAFDQFDAASLLAKLNEKKIAADLGLNGYYDDICMKISHTLGSVKKEHVKKLYGDQLTLSASQIDTQAQCRLAYFLKYGLRAKEQKEATVDPAEFGTYIHAVLEQTAAQVMQLGGFHKVSLEETMDIAMNFSEEYILQRFSQMDSQRLSYLFQRNRRELEMVVVELWRELKQSSFAPVAFELGFGKGQEMEPIALPSHGMQAVLRGFVDRVDIWEKDNRHYFRVVDYKTGKKDFDYCDIFNGVGLQMLLYLFALEQSGEKIVGSHSIAAGVQYFPARAPIVNVDGRLTDEEAAAERKKSWIRKGLLLNNEDMLLAMDDESMSRLCCTRKKDGSIAGDLADGDQLQLLRKYLFRFLGNLVDEISSGNVNPNPYTRGTAHNACTYCPYGSICKQQGQEERRNYKAMDANRFWEEIAKEVEHDG